MYAEEDAEDLRTAVPIIRDAQGFHYEADCHEAYHHSVIVISLWKLVLYSTTHWSIICVGPKGKQDNKLSTFLG